MSLSYLSTRSGPDATGVDLATAIRRGLAPDGGLYLPSRLAPLSIAPFAVGSSTSASLAPTAIEVLAPYLVPAFDLDRAADLLRSALDFPVPLVPLGEGLWLLELFHGPTLAFKDVGARTLARLLAASARSDETLTVLTATSGDTGGAVADAFHRVAGTRVVVLYPKGQVSDRQERQFATLGDNVHALAVSGAFDDCQRLAKAALSDPTLVVRHGLTSANSINLGRLLPQVTYYVHAFRQLPLELRDRAVFVVPSGNFGNLTAGLMAMKSGLPVRRFVAAVNANDVVPEYLDTGRFSPRPSVTTLANAMDVGNPSNLERIRSLFDDDLDALREVVTATSHDDESIRTAIQDAHRETGRVLDPHTAVGWRAWLEHRERHPESVGILLGTAHPAKFHDIVEPLLGRTLPVPEALAEALERPLLSRPLMPEVPALAAELERIATGADGSDRPADPG